MSETPPKRGEHWAGCDYHWCQGGDDCEKPMTDTPLPTEAMIAEIEHYGEGLVPGLRIVCTWLVAHFRDPEVIAELEASRPTPKASESVEQAANDLTVALTERLLEEFDIDEDADCSAIERWSDYSDKLIAEVLAQTRS